MSYSNLSGQQDPSPFRPRAAHQLPLRPSTSSGPFARSDHSYTRSAPPRPRPEDAQPSEAVTTNRRPQAPPSVIPVSQSTIAGNWASSPSGYHQGNGHDRTHRWSRRHSDDGIRERTRQSWNPVESATSQPYRSHPQTIAGGWSTNSSSADHLRANDTRSDKGKERQWGSIASTTDSRSANPVASYTRVPVPVPVPVNPKPTIWISQLPLSITEEEIRTVFSPFGTIEKVVVNLRPLGNYAFAHVNYADTASASNAITALNLQPFPSTDGIGSSRPIRVSYAQSPQSSAIAGQGSLGRTLAVTTEPPASATEAQTGTEGRLFRARDTPDCSQVSHTIKREMESPSKNAQAAAEVENAGANMPDNGRGSGSSSRHATPSADVPSSTSQDHYRREHSPHSPVAPNADRSDSHFPRFINPPLLTLDSITLPPTRIGIFDPNDGKSKPKFRSTANPRRYILSYRFSPRLASVPLQEKSRKALTRWAVQRIASQHPKLQSNVDRSSVRLTRIRLPETVSMQSGSNDPREEESGGYNVSFALVVSRKALDELGRDEPWTREEEETNKRQLLEADREISSKLEELGKATQMARVVTNNRRGCPRYVNPPPLSVDGIALVASSLGTLSLSHELWESPVYVLRYIYPLELPSLSSTSASPSIALKSELKKELAESGLRLSSMSTYQHSPQNREGKDTIRPGKDQGVAELYVEVVREAWLASSGRRDEWSSEERKNAFNRLLEMRRSLQAKLGPPVTAANDALTRIQDGEREGPQLDGTIVEKISLPPDLIGTTPEQIRRQTLLRVEEVKKRSAQGKVVLSSSVEGTFIVINYFLEVAPGNGSADGSNVNQQQVSHLDPLRRGASDALSAESDDIKPTIADDREEGMEVDPIGPISSNDDFVAAAKFPLGELKNSRADSIETYQAATAFIEEYFRRFDSSRGALEGFYTRNAIFSLKVDTTPPHRLTTGLSLFSRDWYKASNKFVSTPVPITNLIKTLPACSHNLNTMLFNARTIPEFHLRKRARPPILLHLTGELEEFETKTIRRFARTFVLVPHQASEGLGEFIAHSDQLLVGHAATADPREIQVIDPPFQPGATDSQAPTRAPPAVVSAPLPHLESYAHTFSPPPSHQPLDGPQTVTKRRPEPQPQLEPRQPPASEVAPQIISDTIDPSTRTSEKRRRSSTSAGRSPQLVATNSSPDYNPRTLPPAVIRRFSDAEVLELSDSESATSHRLPSEPSLLLRGEEDGGTSQSMSPELSRPAKRPNLANVRPDQRFLPYSTNEIDGREARTTDRYATPLATSPTNDDTSMFPSDKSQGQPASTSLGAQDANSRLPSGSTDLATEGDRSIRSNQFLLPEDIQKFIAEQVAKEVEEKLRKARALETSPPKKKATKGKEKDDDKLREPEREKKKKPKDKKDKVAEGLGTGLSPGDSRIVIAGLGHSILHGFDGRSNKLRGMVQSGDASSFLSVSFLGDIAEWSMQPLNSMTSSSITKLYSSNQDKYRVDDFTYNAAKDTLLVGYLGAKEGKEMACPPNQVVLYKRDTTGGGTKLVETRLTEAPHVNGGVTAIMALPNKATTGRLRFVTGGEDKKVYLWTRQRSTQSVKLDKFVTEHTSMITSFAFLEAKNELVSAGKDRRVVTYDLERRAATWQAALSTAVMSVSSVVCDPNLIMSRLATPSEQFLIHDRRMAASGPPIVTFGYDLPPHRSTNGALLPTNMGRYPRGDQMDTVVAFPDHDQGVKMWDLRQLRTSMVKRQDLGGLGRSKVVQASFKGRNELCLMELAHFTRLSIKG